MDQLRVLHVVGGYPTPEKPFHQVFVKTQVDSLGEAGAQCDVLNLMGAGFRKYMTGWWQVRRALEASDYDLIHAHYAYCGAVSLGHGKPVVTSLLGSDLYGVPRPDGTYPRFTRMFHGGLSRWVTDRSDACIVKSGGMAADLGRPVEVVANGVDLSVFKPVSGNERAALRNELGLDSGTWYILFTSDPVRPVKRYPLARQAVEIAASHVDRPVELRVLSGLAHAEVVRHMQACDMMVLTSSHEGSPNVIKEAMAAGMAVVSVDVGDTRERLEGVSGCRISTGDSAEELAMAIGDLIDNDESRGGPAAVAPLAMETVAERVVSIYRGVLTG